MLAFDLFEKPAKEAPTDSLALRLWMNRDGKVTQDVRKDAQLAAVSMQLRGQARYVGSFRDNQNSSLEAVRNESIHVIAGDLFRRTRNPARSSRDSLIQ